MNLYRTTTFLALALILPASAHSQPSGEEACESLKALSTQVLGLADALRCRPDGETLTLEGKDADFLQIRAAAFPQDRYQEFAVVRRDVAPMTSVRAAPASAPKTRRAPTLGETFKGLTATVDFDGANSHSGSVVLAGGPPGSAPPAQQKDPKPKKGPPGSQPPAQDSPDQQPPGKKSRGGDDAPPPSSSQPPSRPTPVFVPNAPPPNYWNTIDWGTVPMWASLPSDWQDSEFNESDNRYITRWYPYSRPFVSDLGYTKDTKSVTRRAGMDDFPIGLMSREVIETKQCYYQGVYDLRWNSYEGRWDGRFSHYRAACRRSEEYGDAIRHNIRVVFDMKGRSLLPWEAEIVSASFDGTNTAVGVEYPAFQYAQSTSGDTVYYRAGAKNLTAPDENGVTAELLPDGQALKLRVFDKWAGYYSGETLEVSLKLMFVTPGIFTRNKPVDLRAYTQGNQIRWKPSAAPGAPGSGGGFEENLTTTGCGTYYLDSWSFRRANNKNPENQSSISSGATVQKGGSQRIKLCK